MRFALPETLKGIMKSTNAKTDNVVTTEQYQWLTDRAHSAHDRSIMPLDEGTPVYSPMGYRGCWPRDMYYIITGVPELARRDIMANVVELCLKLQLPNGMVPKNIASDVTPRYVCWHVPGGYDVEKPLPLDDVNPLWNDYEMTKPEADSGQFVVMVAHEYWKGSGDTAFVKRNLGGLARALDAMPRDESGLIWIDPKHPHTTYGFTDNVVKTGNELFCSLLYREASRMLAQMAKAVGDADIAKEFTHRAEMIEENIDRLKDSETGVYFAATEIGRQIDIWGNAYLVYSGFPGEERRQRICQYLADNYDRYVKKGQIRHINRPDYWQKMYFGSVGDIYGLGVFQNGAYWGTPTGWVGYAIAQVNPKLASQLFTDLITTYQEQGAQEYIYEDGRPGPIEDYGSSLTNPLHAIRRLERERIGVTDA